MKAKYIGKSIMGFKKNHEYEIIITAPNGKYHAYDCDANYDYTEDKSVDLGINYASLISVKRSWKYNEEEGDF